MIYPHIHTYVSNAHRYGQALALLRRQHGDLNFLVDYDPLRFENEGCRLLVEQVRRKRGEGDEWTGVVWSGGFACMCVYID